MPPHRHEPLLELLERYRCSAPDERVMIDRIRGLIHAHDDCLLRSCPPGHITASTWIVSADLQSFLLTHHRKLDRWLQLGGHVDGEAAVHEAALREAQEESGMERFRLVSADLDDSNAASLPLDVDVHGIPVRPGEPAHEHHDFRFLLIAMPDQPLQISSESNDLRWFPWERLDEIAGDDSVRRLGVKAKHLLRDVTPLAGT